VAGFKPAPGNETMTGLRNGFTTGTCAAAAAKAAAMLLCESQSVRTVAVSLPDGSREELPVFFVRRTEEGCEAAVRKDAGDDPDITNGVDVVARVSFCDGGQVCFEAGEGVGKVTLPGLSVPPGEPAINPGPREMIRSALAEVAPRGFRVRVSIPGGDEIARKTFNPRLGVVGGLSILGTTGRVRPFSAAALTDSLKCALSVAAACDVRAPVLVPGNIGERAARGNFRLSPEQVIEVSNQWGEMLDETLRYDFANLLIVGHPGKLAKLTAGEWNTHSDNSQNAVPIVQALAAKLHDCPVPDSVTAEGVFQALDEGRRSELADFLASEIRECVKQRLGGRHNPAVAVINMRGEILGTGGDLQPWL
jgi:cobalt-precorrin-5B (C1)-methyltransferase